MHLNHTIVDSRDREVLASFLGELLGLPPPRSVGPFAIVQIDADLTFDFMDAEGEVRPQHYAFLVTEAEFDEIFSRIRARGLAFRADPQRSEPGRINTWDDGRGVYFDDKFTAPVVQGRCEVTCVPFRFDRELSPGDEK